MAISVRYRLRPPKKDRTYSNPHVLQCRITVNGRQDAGFTAYWNDQKILVDPGKWKVDRQRTSQRDDPANSLISCHRAAIEEIHRNQVARGWKPTIESIKYELTEGLPVWDGHVFYFPAWDTAPKPVDRRLSEESKITDAYAAYVVELGFHFAYWERVRWNYVAELLKTYLTETGQPDLPCYKITMGWARRFHAWMQTIKTGRHRNLTMSAGQATRHLNKISAVLTWLCDEQLLGANPVASGKWPSHQTKEAYFLEGDDVNKAFLMTAKGTGGTVLWWWKLMMLTGLDYPDAVQYARNRSSYEKEVADGRMIVGHRLKPPKIEYSIPVLPELEILFRQHPEGAEKITGNTINKYTYLIEDHLGFKKRITAKTARKTAGVLFLYAGYTIAEVSKILGHKSVRTTEKYYVKVTQKMVENAMIRVNKKPLK